MKKRKRNGYLWAVVIILILAVEIPCSCYLTGGRDISQEEQGEAISGISDTEAGTETVAGTESAAPQQAKKQDVGDLYTVAESYEQVYEVLKEQEERWEKELCYDMAAADGATGGESGARDMAAAIPESAVENATAGDTAAVNAGAKDSYSTTNVMTEGVDESDIAKTDGSYLYLQSGRHIKIIDVRGEEMKEAGTISVSGAGNLLEMYVEGDLLCLITEQSETDMGEETEDVYRFDTKQVTKLQTYDISNRSKPVLLGSVTQDGSYKTSRKIGDVVYLFTHTGIDRPALTATDMEKSAGGWIPLINGEPVAADCIYISEEPYDSLLVSSVRVNEPDQVVDKMMILNGYVDIYVSRQNLYLYGSSYSGNGMYTTVAKFSMKDGTMDGVGACTAKGELYDSFAIHEQNGKLRLLMTDWANDENALYLYDENLKMTGSLERIAKGEQIYAARYFGDTAYFVTYRNTDPLFAVDLSDEKNPKILSELKITGFSEYLHFWGPEKLLGIGYETDPDSGERKGLKLTMFDISEPADLKTIETKVLKGVDYSPALYEYKTVLADESANLIGFSMTDYDKDESSYRLFAWEDEEFESLLTVPMETEYRGEMEACRGIYIGEKFYLTGEDKVASYDRGDGYKLLQELEL